MDHIVAAVDYSESSYEAARAAAQLSLRMGADLTLLSVLPGAHPTVPGLMESSPSLGMLERLHPTIVAEFPKVHVEMATTGGLPPIEIGRFAESRQADLLVLGRKSRSRADRLFLGDTADAVLRRSRIPCMLVPVGRTGVSHVLASLDGTDRGFMVFEYAVELASHALMTLNALTVDPIWPGETVSLGGDVKSGRAERLSERIQQRVPHGRRGLGVAACGTDLLQVRRGDTVTEIAAAITELNADILVIGFHRGGPAMMVNGESVSRQLLHVVPSIVITVPL